MNSMTTSLQRLWTWYVVQPCYSVLLRFSTIPRLHLDFAFKFFDKDFAKNCMEMKEKLTEWGPRPWGIEFICNFKILKYSSGAETGFPVGGGANP